MAALTYRWSKRISGLLDRPLALLVILILVSALVGAACAGATATPSPVPPTATAVIEEEHEEEEAHEEDHDMEVVVAAGRQLFLSKGCASCHGHDAEGTTVAPALPGHTALQFELQVRSPLAQMPAFSEIQISNEELEQIAAYIVSLALAAGHIEPIAMEDVVAMHHWMALSALAADNLEEAEHHVTHIIELVQEDTEHLHQMEEVLEALQAGDVHRAEHPIEAMLAGTAEPNLTPTEMHLRLALVGLEATNINDARHHMEHFIEESSGADKSTGQEILDFLEEGNLLDARYEMEELLGLEGHADH